MKDNKDNIPVPDGGNIEEWEKYLDAAVGKLDLSVENSINDAADSLNDLLSKDSLEEIINEVQNQYGIRVTLNYESCSLEITDKVNNKSIGNIYPTSYTDGNIYTEDHLFFSINDEYKGKGFGKLLFNLYDRISLEENNFEVFETEYTNLTSMVFFYLKNGYEIVGKAVSGMNVNGEFDEKDYQELDRIKSEYLAGHQEEYLNYTVILQKIT